MAYNSYFPQFYGMQNGNFNGNYNGNYNAQQNSNGNNTIWVQGEASAKAYPVAPNTSVLLMDSESPVMYIKTTDNSGMPLPLRIFDYKERTEKTTVTAEPIADMVTRAEFDELKEEVRKLSKPPVKKTSGKEE